MLGKTQPIGWKADCPRPQSRQSPFNAWTVFSRCAPVRARRPR